ELHRPTGVREMPGLRTGENSAETRADIRNEPSRHRQIVESIYRGRTLVNAASRLYSESTSIKKGKRTIGTYRTNAACGIMRIAEFAFDTDPDGQLVSEAQIDDIPRIERRRIGARFGCSIIQVAER